MNGSGGPRAGVRVWRAYDETGAMRFSKTAKDANSDINPAEIRRRIDDIVETAEREIKDNIIRELWKAYLDQNGTHGGSVILNAVDLTTPESDMENAINQIPGEIDSRLSPLYDMAQEARNSLQHQYNDIAYNETVNHMNGMVSRSEIESYSIR